MPSQRIMKGSRDIARYLEMLGASLDRTFRVDDEDAFAELLRRLDQIPAIPIDRDQEQR